MSSAAVAVSTAQMEALYAKLYDKYQKLRTRKFSEIEQQNLDQEEKFKTYVKASDELIGYLTSEKERLSAQISVLQREVDSIRSAKDKDQQNHEQMLMEMNQKIKQLSEETERLRRKELDSNEDQLSPSPGSSNNSRKRKRPSPGSSNNSRKRKRPVLHEKETDEENMFSGAFYNDANQPKCCLPRLGDTVNADSDSSSPCCMFQELFELLANLKFSVGASGDDNVKITAVHESSGYSFSLGWVKMNGAAVEDQRLMMYSALSLGTFERVAPEWMRDVRLISKSMLTMFFKRLSTYVS